MDLVTSRRKRKCSLKRRAFFCGVVKCVLVNIDSGNGTRVKWERKGEKDRECEKGEEESSSCVYVYALPVAL